MTFPGSNAAELRLDIQPKRAAVFVDDNYMGHGGDFGGRFHSMLVSPGKHRLKVALAGYQNYETEIDAVASNKSQMKIVLEKVAATPRRDSNLASLTLPWKASTTTALRRDFFERSVARFHSAERKLPRLRARLFQTIETRRSLRSLSERIRQSPVQPPKQLATTRWPHRFRDFATASDKFRSYTNRPALNFRK